MNGVLQFRVLRSGVLLASLGFLSLHSHSADTVDRVVSHPAVCGSTRPGMFLADCLAGTESLDIVVIGDSNTGSALEGLWGYHNGLSEALLKLGARPYATAVFPTMLRGTIASTGGWRCWTYFPSSKGTALIDGSTLSQKHQWSSWNCLSALMRYGPTEPPSIDGWALVPTGQYLQTYNAVFLQANNPMSAFGEQLVFRVRYGEFSEVGGSFTPAVFEGDRMITQGAPCNSGSAKPVLGTCELEFLATGDDVRAAWSGGGSVGPVAIQWQSIYRRCKGWSVTSHAYMSGSTQLQIATAVTSSGRPYVESVLREHRERQRAAGGRGRLLLWIHGGINGTTTPAEWSHSTERVISMYRSVWQDLGFPADDLAAIAFVGVQSNAADLSNGGTPLAPVRTFARELGYRIPELAVIHMPSIISYAELARPPSLYQGFPDNTAHLSGGPGTVTDGYSVVSQRVIDRLVLHAQCLADIDGSTVVDSADMGFLMANWNLSGALTGADISGDGRVDGSDLVFLLDGWGPCPP